MSKSVWHNGTLFTDTGVSHDTLVFGNRAWTMSNYTTLMPTAGTVSLLRVLVSAAPGASKTRTFTLYKNGVSTSLTVTLGATDTTGSDESNSVSVAASDRLSLRATATSGVAAAYLRFCLQFDSDTAKYSILCGATPNLSQTDTLFMSLTGGSLTSTTVKIASFVLPCSGTIRSLYVWLSAAPGGVKPDIRRRRFTVTLNGVNQTLTTLISASSTTGNDTSHSFAVVAGDYVSVECEPIPGGGTDPDASHASVSIVLEAAKDGEFIVPASGPGGFMSPTNTEYTQITTGIPVWALSETQQQCLTQAITFTRLQAELNTVAVSGDYEFHLRRNGSTIITATVTSGNTSGQQIDTEFVENFDLLNFEVVPISSPVKNTVALSLLGSVIEPAGAALMMCNF